MLRVSTCLLVAAALVAVASSDALAQQQREYRQQRDQQSRDCTVQRERSGLVRGDQIPRGCVLPSTGGDKYKPPTGHQWSTALGPCEQYSERIFHTPNPKRSVLANGARICRPILEASNPASWPGGDDFESFNNNFGTSQRHFGSSQRNFGSSRRHFGSSQRSFGSSSKKFDSTQRNFGSRSPRSGGQQP